MQELRYWYWEDLLDHTCGYAIISDDGDPTDIFVAVPAAMADELGVWIIPVAPETRLKMSRAIPYARARVCGKPNSPSRKSLLLILDGNEMVTVWVVVLPEWTPVMRSVEVAGASSLPEMPESKSLFPDI